MLLIQDPELLMLDEPVAGMSVSERGEDRRAAQRDHQEPLGDRDRARHEVRREHRAPRHGAAPGQGAGRRRHAVGAGQSARSRKSISAIEGAANMFEVTQSVGRLRPERGAARHRSLACGPARSSRVVGRNGMGKSTLMKSLIGVMPARSGQIIGRRRRCHRAAEPPAGRAAASPTCRRAGRSSAP